MERIEIDKSEILNLEIAGESLIDCDYPNTDARSKVIVSKTMVEHRRIVLKRKLDRDIRGAFEVITPDLTMIGYLSSDKMSIIEY